MQDIRVTYQQGDRIVQVDLSVGRVLSVGSSLMFFAGDDDFAGFVGEAIDCFPLGIELEVLEGGVE